MTVPLSELEARSVDVQLFEWDATSYWWKRIAEVKGVMTGASVKDHIFTGLDADKAHSYLVFSVSGGITTVHFQGHEEPIRKYWHALKELLVFLDRTLNLLNNLKTISLH